MVSISGWNIPGLHIGLMPTAARDGQEGDLRERYICSPKVPESYFVLHIPSDNPWQKPFDKAGVRIERISHSFGISTEVLKAGPER